MAIESYQSANSRKPTLLFSIMPTLKEFDNLSFEHTIKPIVSKIATGIKILTFYVRIVKT